VCYIKTITNAYGGLHMQQLKTITVKTSNKVESVHMDTLYAVIENCYNKLQVVEADCTGASYFLNSANIFAQLQCLYVENECNDYVSIASVMEIFSNNITFYDESCLFTEVAENTALQNINIENYVSMCN
tara:strand:+ start:230 stop:619 length:390 start_codon:yes stop_codon:yes gene_type:complete